MHRGWVRSTRDAVFTVYSYIHISEYFERHSMGERCRVDSAIVRGAQGSIRVNL